MNETVVVLGNGFDMDMGWKTSYKDFLTSDTFSIMGQPRYSLKYTDALWNRMGANWYDLEGFMRVCVENAIEDELDELNLFWQICRDKICYYLTLKDDRWQQRFETDKKSCAYVFLKNIKKADVFSFNYTLPYRITLLPERKIVYVHGALKDDLSWTKIKLGIDMNVKNKLARSEKLKPYLKAYGSDKKNLLLKAVKSAENIVFFGHSMSITDSDYFLPLLSNIIDGTLPDKSLYFITKNEETMQGVKDNMLSYGIDYDKLIFSTKECSCILTTNGVVNNDFQKLLEKV